MPSSGPNYGASASQSSNPSLRDWDTPSNALSSDNTRALVTLTGFLGSGAASEGLFLTDLGFAIPGGSTIDGVVVEVEGYAGTSWTQGNTARLYHNGSLIGDAKSITLPVGSGSEAFISAGASNDLWNATLTTSIINDSTFGVQFQAQCNNFDTTGGRECFVDSIRITVYYTEVSGSHPHPRRSRRVRNLLRM